MTAKERLLKALEGEAVDRVPVICPGGMMNMITKELMDTCGVRWPEAHHDPKQMAALALASYENDCFENMGVPFCMTIEAEEMGAKVDFGNDVYEPHVTEYALQSVSEYKKLGEIDFSKGRGAVVLEAIRILKEKNLEAPIVGNITGPISTASSVMEPMIFYKELRKNPEEAHAYMEYVTRQLINLARLEVEAGADVIAISDPSGTGEILGPRFFEQYAVKYLNMLLDGIKETGVKTIVHICGDMKNVYTQINMVHSNALSFDSIVPMRQAREQLPDRVLMGNVSTYTLEFGDEKQVKAFARSCRDNGSNIISPACGLGTQSPLVNIQAILKAIKESEE